MAEDFMKDGLLHCGVCGRPKEYKFSVLGIDGTARVMCACEVEAEELKKDGWKDEQRMFHTEHMIADGVHDRARRNCRFENAENTENIEKCLKYVENWPSMKAKNVGVLMWGTPGNGKSFAAACIANALIERDVPVLMTSLPTILEDRDNINIVKQMKEYDLVIIDDLGAERQSQYALEKTFFVIDERYKIGKPLIVTTNQRLDDMLAMRQSGDIDHKRIYDRVLAMCVPMAFREGTRRNEEFKPRLDALKEAVQ